MSTQNSKIYSINDPEVVAMVVQLCIAGKGPEGILGAIKTAFVPCTISIGDLCRIVELIKTNIDRLREEIAKRHAKASKASSKRKTIESDLPPL